ncbi:hypothetical protein [Vibrio algarum]|uniref:Uncharacterized protein n=1 Tax=Vibrio algarum TaxID=3020714 RepID=A0ABT4YR61_9VIBR|nr:hypothetical protein [Vibrio sp. KJ40-1]MDB1124044.1 hypothetical protein [Vibrio sp. KJ40-1]
MLADTIERVNKLRKQALNNPEFVRSSKEHERNIALAEKRTHTNSKRAIKKQKRFDEVYQQSEFGVNPSGLTH